MSSRYKVGLLLKTLLFDLALKGAASKPRRKCHEITFGFSR